MVENGFFGCSRVSSDCWYVMAYRYIPVGYGLTLGPITLPLLDFDLSGRDVLTVPVIHLLAAFVYNHLLFL